VFQNKLIDRFGPMPPRAKALMNSIRIKWIATALESKISDETRQDDWVFHFGSTIRLLSIQTFSSSLAVCAKKQFYLQNERKTNSLLRLLLTLTMQKHQNS
jgi:transcription-repair coupling factor (superfamily II helicase)